MNKETNPIFHNINCKKSDKEKEPTCLIMGNIGAGKTCLKNLICGTNHKSGFSIGSVTDKLYENLNNCGNHSFTIIDTPGIDSTVDTYKHSFLLRHALTAKNINTLFIVLKFDNRVDHLETDLIKILEPVYKYSEKIVLMISHWDNSENPKENFKKLEEVLGTNSKYIICYSKHNSKDEIADLMYLCMSEMKPEKLVIPKDEFFLNFNLYQINSNMKREYLVYSKKIEERQTGLYKFIDTIQDLPKQEKDEILHSINIEAKYTLEEVLEEFQLKFKEIMIELDYFCFYIKLQKQILKICDSFSNKIKSLMSFDLDDNSDPRNNIKKCPYCGEIWVKVDGCDGLTKCGDIPTSKDFKNNKIFLKYEISWSDKKFTYKKKVCLL